MKKLCNVFAAFGSIVADFLTAGLALIAVGTNFVVLYAVAAAASALQEAENNAASAGCASS